MQNIIVSTIDISNNLINTLCENNYRKILYQIAMNRNEFQNFQIKKKRIAPPDKNFFCAKF